MLKKCLLFFLIALTLCSVGCKSDDFSELTSSVVAETPSDVVLSQPELFPNPLTGIKEVEEGNRNLRPVAIMINNITVAQPVECGLNDADIVYECLVEGGISRLMAVYYDVSKVEKIGSIRSARYTYVQLARGLDAAYVHCGRDRVYTEPYMNEIKMDNYDLMGYSDSCYRENNGLAYEHRLFTSGEKLTKGMKKRNRRLTSKKETTPNAFSFAQETQTFATPCNKVTYVMSSGYKTTFTYNAQTKKYTRCPMGTPHKDNRTKEETVTDNLFILYAESPHFEDNHHRRTILSKGKGLYVSNGTCTNITWKKGEVNDPLKFYTENGEELKINPGKSWIAFPTTANKSKTVIE